MISFCRGKVVLHDWQDTRRIYNIPYAQPRQAGSVKWIKPTEGRDLSAILAILSFSILIELEYEFA